MKKSKNNKQVTKPVNLSKNKKIFFWGILIIIQILFLILFEIILRITDYGINTDLFVSTPDENSKYYGINTNVAKRYFYSDTFFPTPRKDLFLKKKLPNGYRIFVLGGSTAAGYPYGNNVTFSRILNRRLNDTFPEKHIEVINVSMTAINTYAMIDFIDEILEQEPDAILIYAGHNEFYGALGVSSMESLGQVRGYIKFYLKFQRFKTFQLVRKGITDLIAWFWPNTNSDRKKNLTKTAMAKIVGDKEIVLNGTIYKLGVEQFTNNVSEILIKCKELGVKVLMSELVSNLKDQKPFVSVEDDKLPSADNIYNQAIKSEKSGNYSEAKILYYQAKDLDALRFRASEDINEIIHSLGVEQKVPVVPMKEKFELNSENGLIGNGLMHEHLHPNLKGYFLMADAFYNKMKDEKFISEKWPYENYKPEEYYINNWGVSNFDSVYAEFNIKQLKGGWPFKKSGTNEFLKNIVPSTKEESLALNIILNGNKTAEMAHIELANFYEEKGEYLKAYKEHRALIYTVPYLDLFYEPMVKLLLKTKQYHTGYLLLLEAERFNQSAFIYKWLGQFSLITNLTTEGIDYLKIALNETPNDIHILVNLTRANYKLKKIEEGDRYLEYIKNLSPNSNYIESLLEYRRQQKL